MNTDYEEYLLPIIFIIVMTAIVVDWNGVV